MERPTKQHSYQRIALTVLGVITGLATLSAVYFALQARRHALRAQFAAQELSVARNELASAREQLAIDRSHLLATASVPPNAAPTPNPSGATDTQSPPRASPTPDFRAAFHSPVMREMVRQTHLTRLRPIYDPLLTQLNLSLEERARFYDLQVTVDDPVINLDKVPSEAQTPEERAQIENQIRQNRETALQQLSDLLGSQAYQLYEGYRTTQDERTLVQQFRQQADPRSAQITDWQYDRLRDLLIQARSQYPPLDDDFSASYAAALRQASAILTPDQLASFRKYLQSQEDMRKTMREVLPPGG